MGCDAQALALQFVLPPGLINSSLAPVDVEERDPGNDQAPEDHEGDVHCFHIRFPKK
jgi:hypothetical protein